ncbi:hypothetical protein [Hoeflea sp.]|uniref:hypothetical protein n=1 Tax=Hoeflea sp. TaxID=1940281 RepID=UPI003B021D18
MDDPSGGSNFINQENKTGTKAPDTPPLPLAPALGISRVWREVIDFGEPTSGNGEEGWGRKRVSVARVSILDAATADQLNGSATDEESGFRRNIRFDQKSGR